MATALHTMAPFEMLQKAGFNQQQTLAILNTSFEIYNSAELATKHDLNALEMRFDHKIDALGTRLDHKIDVLSAGFDHKIDLLSTGFDHKINAFRAELDNLSSKLTIRLGAIVVSTVTLLPYLTDFLHLPRP